MIPFSETHPLLAGIVLLIAGGEALVRGAANLARQLGISSLVVGLTVVAFATSAPELAVNVSAAIRGNGAVAFGNRIEAMLLLLGYVAYVLTRSVWRTRKRRVPPAGA